MKKKWQQQLQLITEETEGEDKEQTIPNKNTIASAATMDNPAPDSDASVKSLGIFLQDEKIRNRNYINPSLINETQDRTIKKLVILNQISLSSPLINEAQERTVKVSHSESS